MRHETEVQDQIKWKKRKVISISLVTNDGHEKIKNSEKQAGLD